MKLTLRWLLFLLFGLLLLGLWIGWGAAIIFVGRSLPIDDPALGPSLTHIANFAAGFGVLGTLITSFTVILAAMQLTQNSDETKSIVASLKDSAEAQTRISRSQQIELLFGAHVGRYLDELQTGVHLWGETANSMHGIRNILERAWAAQAQGDARFADYEAALGLPADQRTAEQAVFARAVDALSQEIEQMGVKCLTGSVPAGVIISQMGGHWPLQWSLCRAQIRANWAAYGNVTAVEMGRGRKVEVNFSRRHGYWLAICSALYVLRLWPAGNYAVWAVAFLEAEFGGDARAADEMMWAIYRCDEPYFGTNPQIEALMAEVAAA